MKDKILYFDLETTIKNKIVDVGALYKGEELHEKGLEKLKSWIQEAKFICGHNILAHDIPILIDVLGTDLFNDKKLIDTLLWSPLLFAKRPYHKLVKGYKIVNEKEYSNPLSDCILTKELLAEELQKFDNLDPKMRSILIHLLSDMEDYKSFIEINKDYHKEDSLDLIPIYFKGLICSNAGIENLVEEDPISLAYALSVIETRDRNSICSSWLIQNIPKSQIILEELRFSNCGNESCKYCSNKLDPKQALLKYFEYENFRNFDYDEEVSLQEKTVRAGLQNESFVAVFPTGGGKSLTFQLPALMKGDLNRQLTVVISPLVSLMKDQVDVLQSRFHVQDAVFISGLLSPLERKEAFEQVEDGRAHILYIAPESLRSPSISNLLKNRSIARFVIDEAHCFSSWGQDFRVDYLYIGEFIKNLNENRYGIGDIPVSCFTATAKPQVIDDIKSYFSNRLDLDLSEYITRAERKNLEYEVIDVEEKEKKDEILLELLNEIERPVIVYASRVKTVEKIATLISTNKLSCTLFHGKLDKDEKKRNQEAFMSGECDIIVATSAFGMGVDKDNIRTVIHYDISDSLENYTQEAGRAGRKEEIKAKCYILFLESDLNKHFSLLQQTKINLKEIQQIWSTIKHLTKFREKISKSALEIAKNAGWDTEVRDLENKVTASISALEDRGFLKRKLNSPRVFADSLQVRKLDKALEILSESKEITDNQRQECTRIVQVLVKEDQIRLDYLADRLEMKLNQAQDSITLLRDLKILGDAKDLTAFIDVSRSPKSSQNIIKKFFPIERGLLELFSSNSLNLSIRALNQKLEDAGVENTSTDAIHTILDYWKKRNLIEKERIDRQENRYKLRLKDKSLLENDIKRRHEIAINVFRILEERHAIQKKEINRKIEVPVQFSLLNLKKESSHFSSFGDATIKDYERALTFLNDIKAISLEGGFMVIYNKLNISEVDNKRAKFTLADYEKMKKYYDHKIQQIHIVGEYAKKRLQNYQDALTYVNDYFTMEFNEFMKKYFNRRGVELSRAMTGVKFVELFGELDTDQLEIVNSKKDFSLVLAGPGSGKTKVLVHKIASLLLMEDIKSEQFLMLTFSKAAALEFRNRVFQLIPEYGRLIKIATFHGYCFELLGQLGNLDKSQHVINDCIEAINHEDIDISSITNKSVLLLDEFQDVNREEWNLVKTIIEKAGNIRVIAVGDDDQSIYEFRGSSLDFMREFRDKYKAEEYGLIKNYRSRQGIVEFNNQILQRIGERMKMEVELVPRRKTNKAKIKHVRYKSQYFVLPLVEDLIQQNNTGTTAVLTRKNIHALLVSTLLRENGIHSRLIAGIDDFRLYDLLEIRYFNDLIKDKVTESGLIMNSLWNESKELFLRKFLASKHLNACKEAIEFFESQYGKTYEFVDWWDYITQIKTENTLHPDSQSVVVSTIHKSKGKEFDNVFLLMKDTEALTDQDKRLIYVACSRAKNKLVIHSNNSFFDSFDQDELLSKEYDKETSPPDHFELILNHKEVQLGSFEYTRSMRIIENLKTGDTLIEDTMKFGDNEALGLAKVEGRNILLFSKNFMKNKYSRIINEGYKLKKANVEYIVYRYNQEKDKEFKIVLPKLLFVK